MLGCLILVSCSPKSSLFEPHITYLPPQRLVQSLPSSFHPLTTQEVQQEWGKEMAIGYALAKDLDLYRSITAYKRALILMPKSNQDRRLQSEYALAYNYFLGRRYCDTLETIEGGALRYVPETFPAFRDMAMILYDSYEQTEQYDKAQCILTMINSYDTDTARDLTLYTSLRRGDTACAASLISQHPCCETLSYYFSDYCRCRKSVRTAQTLNAILPGAGYYYVGQCKSAITSFILNTLFIAATVQFAQHDLIAPAIITASFELGWYIGGINGAGLAAKEYNERLYEERIKEMMVNHRLFPALMLQTAF